MLKLIQLKRILKKYKNIFLELNLNIIGNIELEGMQDGKIYSHSGEENMSIFLIKNDLTIIYQNKELEKYIDIKLPSLKNIKSMIQVMEITKEIRPNGCIIERLEKIYDASSLIVTDLISKRYVYETQKIGLLDTESLEKNYKMKTVFETYNHNEKIKLNQQDISTLYKDVISSNRAIEIYALYNGIIHEKSQYSILRIHSGHLKEEAFGYKEISGITAKENAICGSPSSHLSTKNIEHMRSLIESAIGYQVPLHNIDRVSLIEAMNYQPRVYKRTGLELEKVPGNHLDELDQKKKRRKHL